MKLSAVLVLVALLAVPRASRADAAREQKAKALYVVGRDAYNAGDFQKAYDSFMESFTLSHQPALLYNIASALQGLKRPHDAAEALQSYLRLKPDDPDRPQIEQRIRALEEEQRLLDLDHPRPPPVTPTPVAPTPQVVTPTPSQPLVVTRAPGDTRPSHKKRTALIVGLTVGAVVVAGVAVGLAIGLSPNEEALTPSPFGAIKATR